MKVTVVGSRGMLGSDLVAAGRRRDLEIQGLDLPEIDLTKFRDVLGVLPVSDWVVNCAAYTNVDGAEKERAAAHAVNAQGAGNIARACRKKKMRLMHISTDYVFNGKLKRPYREEDRPDPINVYGASKLAGEKEVRAEGGRFLIVRTQALFGRHGHNFVKAIMRRIWEHPGEVLKVVDDQITAPTYTRHLAEALLDLLELEHGGVVHVSAEGECSWYEFAREIAALAAPGTPVEPITSEELERAAPRPPYTVLNKHRFLIWTGRRMPEWRVGLREYLEEEGWLA